MRMEPATSGIRSSVSCFLAAQERIQEAGVAGIEALFATLQEHVHRLPQGVVENLDQLPDAGTDRRRRVGRSNRLRCPAAPGSWRRRRGAWRSAAAISGSPSGGPKPITMSSGRRMAASHGPNSAERSRAGSARLPDDHRMHEFHRDVLRVGGIGAAAKGQQTAAAPGSAPPWRGRPRPGDALRGRRIPDRRDCVREGVRQPSGATAGRWRHANRSSARDRPPACRRCGCLRKGSRPARRTRAARALRR